jgi:signal transduction histidine kinase
VASRLENTSLAVHLEFPATVPDVRVSALFRRNLLLVTKEALTNLLRHAQARTAGVRLAIEGDQLTLEIHDDGRGFEPDRKAGTGNGLANLQQARRGSRRRVPDRLRPRRRHPHRTPRPFALTALHANPDYP